MNHRSSLRALVGVAVIAAPALTMTAASPAAKHHTKHHTKGHAKHHAKGPVYWLDLSGGSSIAPHRVFFTANAGGYMKKIKWKHWGSKKTVGRGTFGSTAPCGPSRCLKGPARLVLRKPVKCHPAFGNKHGKKIRVYRHGALHYPDPHNGKRRVTNVSDRTGWGACRESYRR